MILKLGTQTITPIITIAGSGSTPLQSKTVDPSVDTVQVSPDGGYALSLVTVNAVTSAIDNNIQASNIRQGATILGVAGNVLALSGTTTRITASTQEVVAYPESPYNAYWYVYVNSVTAAIDSNIKSENIKLGTTILGVTGTYGGTTPTGTLNITSNGTYDVASYASASVSVPEHPYAKRYTSNASFTSYTDSSITTIPYGVFAYTLNLSTVSFAAATVVGSYAFGYCYKLTNISFPEVKTISQYAFQYCSSFNWTLDSTKFPKLAGTIGAYAFRGCQYLTGISLPSVTSVGTQTFSGCSRVSYVNLPLVTNTVGGTFSYLTTCTSYSLPVLKVIGSSAFYSNWALSTLTLPAVTTISAYAFRYCSTLMSLYLTGSTIPTLTATAFANMPMSVSVNNVYGSIFVPASMLASYKAATGWKSYSARIVAIS